MGSTHGAAGSVLGETDDTCRFDQGRVALAEIGDKSQLLALVLAAKYRRPISIILGIIAATLVNHALAGAVGAWVSALVGPTVMRWILGVSFWRWRSGR